MFAAVTLYHLINDSLMPELPLYAERGLFSRAWRHIQSQLLDTERPFIDPVEAFETMQIPVHKEVKAEWISLMQQNWKPDSTPPLKLLNSFYPQEAKTRFFALLFWQYIHLGYEYLGRSLIDASFLFQKQYLLMEFMISLEQFMEDNLQKLSSGDESRKVFQALMAYYWLMAYRKFFTFLHLKSLRYMEEEVLYTFQAQEPNSLFYYFYSKLQPLKQDPEAATEQLPSTSNPLLDLAKTIQTDMGSLKDTLTQIKTGERRVSKANLYIKPAKACEMLNICPQTLSNWRKKGKLKKFRKVANRYEYNLKEIESIKQSTPDTA